MIPPLPKVPDYEGKAHEQPDSGKYWGLVGFCLAMVALAVLCVAFGHIVAAVAIVVVTALIVGALFYEANVMVTQLLGRRDLGLIPPDEVCAIGGDDPDADLAARMDKALSSLLACQDDGPNEVFSKSLAPEEKAVIQANRSAQAKADWDWYQTLPAFEEVQTTSDGGTTLVAHVLRCNPDSNDWLVFAHGYCGTWTEGMLYAHRFVDRGYNIVFCEMRGHGASGGDLIGMGWLDRRDLVAWCEWLVGKQGPSARIVLLGHSMGGASVCLASGESDLPSQVFATVSDCAYSDLLNEMIWISKGMNVPSHPIAEVLRLCLLRRPGGYDMWDGDVAGALSRSKVPVLLFHGQEDIFVPPYMEQRLADSCGGAAAGANHEVVMVEGASHVQAMFADPTNYFARLFFFLDQHKA